MDGTTGIKPYFLALYNAQDIYHAVNAFAWLEGHGRRATTCTSRSPVIISVIIIPRAPNSASTASFTLFFPLQRCNMHPLSGQNPFLFHSADYTRQNGWRSLKTSERAASAASILGKLENRGDSCIPSNFSYRIHNMNGCIFLMRNTLLFLSKCALSSLHCNDFDSRCFFRILPDRASIQRQTTRMAYRAK